MTAVCPLPTAKHTKHTKGSESTPAQRLTTASWCAWRAWRFILAPPLLGAGGKRAWLRLRPFLYGRVFRVGPSSNAQPERHPERVPQLLRRAAAQGDPVCAAGAAERSHALVRERRDGPD